MVQKETIEEKDVVIIGGGVLGAAQLFLLAKYTNISKMVLIEKEEAPGLINSKSSSNSQTLHEGDIETNYNLEKATRVKKASSYTRKYVEMKKDSKLSLKGPKMILGVGDKEVELLEKRYEEFRELFPNNKKLYNDELKKLEPKLFEGRDPNEKLIGLYNEDGLTINYGELAKSLIEDSKKLGRNVNTMYGTKVLDIKKSGKEYLVKTKFITFRAKVVIVAAGSHSLYYAKKLGYGKDYSLLSVAGNFYFSPKLITTKIYTIQDDRLPFAAVHGDPDIKHPNLTRFGPTTNVVFMLERHRYSTVGQYFNVFGFFKGFVSFCRIIFDRHFFFYALKHNVLFRIPFLGRYLFTREIRKIIPKMKFSQIKLARGYGGIRPQVVDTKNKKAPMQFGEVRMAGENIIFKVTPSPGASTCISSALNEMPHIMNFFNDKYTFEKTKFERDFN